MKKVLIWKKSPKTFECKNCEKLWESDEYCEHYDNKGEYYSDTCPSCEERISC